MYVPSEGCPTPGRWACTACRSPWCTSPSAASRWEDYPSASSSPRPPLPPCDPTWRRNRCPRPNTWSRICSSHRRGKARCRTTDTARRVSQIQVVMLKDTIRSSIRVFFFVFGGGGGGLTYWNKAYQVLGIGKEGGLFRKNIHREFTTTHNEKYPICTASTFLFPCFVPHRQDKRWKRLFNRETHRGHRHLTNYI